MVETSAFRRCGGHKPRSNRALWLCSQGRWRVPGGGLRIGAVADGLARDRVAQRAESHLTADALRDNAGVVEMRRKHPAPHAIGQTGKFFDALQ